jgi:ABC-type antimicrobial peptide transport system permease subunit
MSEGLLVSSVGVVVGVVGALFVTRVLTVFLFGVTPLDPVTLATVAGILLVVTAVATVVPAGRAARTNPVVVLRAE